MFIQTLSKLSLYRSNALYLKTVAAKMFQSLLCLVIERSRNAKRSMTFVGLP
ncbi:MAG: hypothetical protein ACKVTZ_23840 [Bacteroidia bacterium]